MGGGGVCICVCERERERESEREREEDRNRKRERERENKHVRGADGNIYEGKESVLPQKLRPQKTSRCPYRAFVPH
jgi:hypothetical protein